MTWGPLVGSLRRWRRDDLYEQCSFHIAETMPSSVKVGVRPISATSRAYSSGFSPCATASASSTFGSVSLKGLRSFSLKGDAWPLALRRDDLKSAGSDRIAKREVQKPESGQALTQRRL